MDTKTLIVSGLVAVATSAITAYLTALLKMKEERKKWDRDFALKYAETVFSNRGAAESLAKQFAVGFLIVQHPDGGRDRVFIPKGGKLTIGRRPSNQVLLRDSLVSMEGAMIEVEGSTVFVRDLFHKNGTFLNNVQLVQGSRLRLSSGDIVRLGETKLIFQNIQQAD